MGKEKKVTTAVNIFSINRDYFFDFFLLILQLL